MNGKKSSYADMASKNVPKPFAPTSSEMYPDELASKKTTTTTATANNFSSTTSKQNGNTNGAMNSMTEDFPPIEGQIPGMKIFTRKIKTRELFLSEIILDINLKKYFFIIRLLLI